MRSIRNQQHEQAAEGGDAGDRHGNRRPRKALANTLEQMREGSAQHECCHQKADRVA